MGTENFESTSLASNKGSLIWKLIPSIIFIIVLGYFREIIFVHINFQRTQVYYHESDADYNYNFPGFLMFLKKLSYKELTSLKWALTVLFFLIYFISTYFIVSKIFKNKGYNKITIGIHLLFFIIAGVFYLAGQITGKGLDGYTLSREFMGILQSPLLLMILLPTFFLSERQTLISSNKKQDK